MCLLTGNSGKGGKNTRILFRIGNSIFGENIKKLNKNDDFLE